MSEFTFRRIRGRVVPIRLNKQQKETSKGIAQAGAGIALGVAAGRSQKVVDKASRFLQKQSFRNAFANLRFQGLSKKAGQLTLDGFAQAQKGSKFRSASINYMKAAKRVVQVNMLARPVMIAASGALTAAGVYKLNKGEKNKEVRAAKAAAFGSAASGAAFASGYMGRRYFKQMVPKLLKNIAKRF